MLKMRRVWRRTSSSQADPSPWRHCWTSWASCSNVSSASKPATVKACLRAGALSKADQQSISACQLWNVNCSRNVPLRIRALLPTVLLGILLTLAARHKHLNSHALKPKLENNHLASLEAFAFIAGRLLTPNALHARLCLRKSDPEE